MNLALGDGSEKSSFRTAYLILMTFAVIGMMICLLLYRYTEFFTNCGAFSSGYSLLSAHDLLRRFGGEVGYLAIVWLCGFTVFALPCGIVYSLWRGFVCGFCAMTLSSAFRAGEFSLFTCVVIAVCSTLIPALEICVAAKAQCFSASLRSAVPELRLILSSRKTLRYTASMLFICLFVFIFTIILAIAF